MKSTFNSHLTVEGICLEQMGNIPLLGLLFSPFFGMCVSLT